MVAAQMNGDDSDISALMAMMAEVESLIHVMQSAEALEHVMEVRGVLLSHDSTRIVGFLMDKMGNSLEATLR
jgi:division protein CdvB (Snf7/Vps24/ESCRT-III family)